MQKAEYISSVQCLHSLLSATYSRGNRSDDFSWAHKHFGNEGQPESQFLRVGLPMTIWPILTLQRASKKVIRFVAYGSRLGVFLAFSCILGRMLFNNDSASCPYKQIRIPVGLKSIIDHQRREHGRAVFDEHIRMRWKQMRSGRIHRLFSKNYTLHPISSTCGCPGAGLVPVPRLGSVGPGESCRLVSRARRAV